MVVWITPPVPAGGACRAPSMDTARTVAEVTPTANRRHDARAEERNNPRLALAAFALQLDAFEMRAGEALGACVRSQASEGETIGGQ
jgi:hypothetical protein